jgi:PhnB protein
MPSTIEAYLNFDGTCAEAMRFYEKALPGAKLEMIMSFAESPDPQMSPPPDASPELKNRTLHASLMLGNTRLMASDTMPGQPYEGMKGFGVAISYDAVDDAKKAFDKLANGGTVGMPLSPTFWAESFGMVTDRFGTCWLINGGPKPMG